MISGIACKVGEIVLTSLLAWSDTAYSYVPIDVCYSENDGAIAIRNKHGDEIDVYRVYIEGQGTIWVVDEEKEINDERF